MLKGKAPDGWPGFEQAKTKAQGFTDSSVYKMNLEDGYCYTGDKYCLKENSNIDLTLNLIQRQYYLNQSTLSYSSMA
jgi:hypothetical protein